MDTLSFIVRYGFLVALLIEAVVVGRAFFGMLRDKARAAATAPAGESAAPQE